MGTFNCSTIFLAASAWIVFAMCPPPGLALAEQSAPGCTICHGMPPVDASVRNRQTGGTIGNHQTHQAAEATADNCAICHTGAAEFTTGHRDGVIALAANINGSPSGSGRYVVNGMPITFKNQTTLPQLGSCSSVNCHFETATPAWGAAQFRYTSSSVNDCDKCHAAAPTDGNHPFGAQKHGVYYGTTTSSCAKCHPDHTTEPLPFAHATSAGNRGLLVQFGTAPNNGFGRYTGNVTYPNYLPSRNSGRNGTCKNLYCHSPGTKAAGSAETPNKSAAWGGTLDCTGCHKGAALDDFMATGSHYSHVFGGGTSYSQIKCVKCHAATATSSMTIADMSRHVDGQIDVAFNSSSSAANGSYNGSLAKPLTPATKTPGSGYGSCQNVYCHSTGQADGGGWPPVYTTPTWGAAATGKCGTCHGTTGSTTHGGFLNASVQRRISSGSHKKHLGYTYGLSDSDMRCAACHAYEKASFNSKFSTCGPVCHTGTPLKHSNYVIDIGIATYFGSAATYNGTAKPGDGYSTCSTVYCHSDGRAVPETYGTPTWGNAASGACGTCHGATAAAPPASAPHVKHVGSSAPYRFACAECHSGKVQATANAAVVPVFTNSTTHVNKAREVNFDSTNPFGTYSSATGSCRNLYCHSTGNKAVASANLPGVYGGSVYTRITWDGNTSCTSCHGRSTTSGMPDYANAGTPGSATSNSHAKHVASSAIDCNECHEKTTKTGTSIRSVYHVNGAPSVFFNLSGGNKTGSYTAATKTCSSTYCHGTASAVAWGGTTSCISCHGATFTTFSSLTKKGAHGLHVQANTLPASFTGSGAGNLSTTASAYQFGCASCHSPARAEHANGVSNANGGAAEVFFGYTSAVMKGTYVPGTLQAATDNGFKWTAGTGCNSSYCHSNGQNAPGRVNVAWNAPKGSLGCDGCHGNGMSSSLSGKHAQHVSVSVNPDLGAGNGFGCANCHAKTVSNGTTISDKRYHVNKFIDYSSPQGGGSARYNSATKQCSNIYCHSDGNPAAIVYADPPAWNSATTLGCNGCHGTDNAMGAPNYANGGSGTATANSHFAHTRNAAATTICADCHIKTASATVNGRFKDYSAAGYHVNSKPDVNFGARAGSSATYNASSGQCSNVACHGNVNVAWGSTGGGCLTCHAGSIGNRAAVGPQFTSNSHHVQGTAITSAHCFQCHWEANADGTINYSYHNSDTSGAPVDLVIYGAGARPATYTEGTTAIRYTANGTRAEFAKINTHCLGCHSDQNNSATPFGDGKTPKQFSWDGSSIATKYGSVASTTWGKYDGANTTPKKKVTKAFSAHGKAGLNARGWDLAETWPNKSGTVVVLCFDCHNSHGSTVSGTTTSYTSGTTNGGILKDTTAGRGGYAMTYKPAPGGTTAGHNVYKAGAALCFDCHLTQNPGAMPWGYQGTYGSTQAILGYLDSQRFGTGTFGYEQRYSYKTRPNQGGHFGVSSSLTTPVMGTIGGLCTPCHDPHGVSPSLAPNQAYAVPMLKGTWMTSPYKEDAAPATTNEQRGGGRGGRDGGGWGGWGSWDGDSDSGSSDGSNGASIPGYYIDQNTFSTSWNFSNTTNRVTEPVEKFGGLCIRCHPKSSIAPTPNPSSPTAWKSVDRIHNSVKGWGTYGKNANNAAHSYTCSKCHSVHNANLPRLMVSNCLDYSHRGRVATGGPTPSRADRDSGGRNGGGNGGFPSGGDGGDRGDHDDGSSWSGGRDDGSSGAYYFGAMKCHDDTNSATYPANQLWNVKTPWGTPGSPR